MPRPRLTAIVTTLNEEANIRECLEGLAFADEILADTGGAGVDVISKSGAFGPSELWRDLLRTNHLLNTESPP